MKTLLLALIYCIIFSINTFATTVITAVTNSGEWKENSTWDLNRIPKTDDIVIIPAGITVEMSNNQYNSVPSYPLIQLYIYGVLQFVETGQLNVQCESIITTMNNGIIPHTGCNCNQITMGVGIARWKGEEASIANGNSVPSPCNVSLSAENNSFENKINDEIKNGSKFTVSYSNYSNEIELISEEVDAIQSIQMLTASGIEIPVQLIEKKGKEIRYSIQNLSKDGIYIIRVGFLESILSTKIIIQQ